MSLILALTLIATSVSYYVNNCCQSFLINTSGIELFILRAIWVKSSKKKPWSGIIMLLPDEPRCVRQWYVSGQHFGEYPIHSAPPVATRMLTEVVRSWVSRTSWSWGKEDGNRICQNTLKLTVLIKIGFFS